MYEEFGFSQSPTGGQSLTLFIPDNTIDPSQYSRGGRCCIVDVSINGDFQQIIDPTATNWDAKTSFRMQRSLHQNGYLYTYRFPRLLPSGFYQYQYIVTFEDSSVRSVGDPCAKYGGDTLDRSAFVVGGASVEPEGIDDRLPTADLVIYELMIDDFTKQYRGSRPAIDAVVDKLDTLQHLNINTIEFMPWIAWPDDDTFSWGYNPAYFFSIESTYVNDPNNQVDRLSRLAHLITECHRRKLHVLLDIVLQHARQGSGTNGFAYYWLWQNPTDSPFVGQFVPAPTWSMLPLDYQNTCTQQFITDVCKYWLTRFKLDGFRFDQVTGFDNPNFPLKGAPKLISDLKQYIAEKNLSNISLILEDDWGYQAIQDANTIQPTGVWFDLFRSAPFGIFTGYASVGQINSQYMRVLHSARDFNFPICPTIYLENHDHGTVTCRLGSRERWYKAQPYMIALATCSGSILLHNGQEWGQFEDLWEDDSLAPAQYRRVQSRPLRWEESTDTIGQLMQDRYRFLMNLRQNHKGMRTPNFYPNDYDWNWRHFSPEGYGIDEQRQVIIYHRWGESQNGKLERFMVVLNFSDTIQIVDIPLSILGQWSDVLNGNVMVTTQDYWLHNYTVNSNWGCIFWRQD